MSKVFYHWGLEERVSKFCLKSNMTCFTRCKSYLFLPNRSLGVQTHIATALVLASNQQITVLLIDHPIISTVESGENLGGHVWIDELMRETGGEFLFARVAISPIVCPPQIA